MSAILSNSSEIVDNVLSKSHVKSLIAVCALSSTEIFTWFFQSVGTYCSGPGWISSVTGPLPRLLVDK